MVTETLEKVSMEGLKTCVRMSEFKDMLNKVIEKAGDDLGRCVHSDNKFDAHYLAVRAGETGAVVKECFRIIDIIDAVMCRTDEPVKELYKYLFRNDPVALNLGRNLD